MSKNLPEYLPFDCADMSNAGPRWKKWFARFEVMIDAMNLEEEIIEDNPEQKALKIDKRKKSLLLFYIGDDCYDIYLTLKEDNDNYGLIKTKLTDYFVPKSNAEYEKFIFRNTKQIEGETLDQFCTKLKKLAINCAFPDGTVPAEVKSQIIQGCLSSQLRKKALSRQMTLAELLETGKALELSKSQVSVMENDYETPRTHTAEVNKVGKRSNFRKKNFKENKSRSEKKCYKCGGSYPHKSSCPALDRKCYNCGMVGHLSKVCKNDRKTQNKSETHVNRVRATSNDDENEYSMSVSAAKENKFRNKLATADIKVNGVSCMFLIDTGASVNIIDGETFDKIKPIKLKKTEKKLFAYGHSKELNVLGKIEAQLCVVKTKETVDDLIYVVRSSRGNLLSLNTAVNLNLISVCNQVYDKYKMKTEEIHRDYADLFEGVGKLKDFQLKLNIHEDVEPVYQKHRRVPFRLRPQVDEAVQKLCDEDICEKVENSPSPWVSPVVMVPKPNDPNKLRLCVDMRAANKAIKRVKHPLPTMDELLHDMNGCKVFSKLDLNQGYHQIELHPESRYITMFSTHSGLFRYKRLSFGINAASEKFQWIIEQVLQGLADVQNYSDDIIIASKDVESHNKNLRACLDRLRESGLTLNLKKCSFFQSSINYFGHVFSENGVSPDPIKVESVLNMNNPVDKSEVRSLCGMITFIARFIPRLTEMIAPIRELNKEKVKFKWTSNCQRAFEKIKLCLSSENTLSYFDPKLPTELIVDGSPCGLGAMLVQNENNKMNIVAYASKALTDVESRYSQIEREALAVKWAIQHFRLYLFGLDFKVISDHKPLVHVFKRHNAKPSPRIERWCLNLQQYKFEVVYKPGSKNPADYLSRHPYKIENHESRNIAEEYINFVCEMNCPKVITLKEMQNETAKSVLMKNIIKCIETNHWYKYKDCEEMHAYEKLHSELSFAQGCVLRGRRIVIPPSLRKRIISAAHEGHQGIVKTKALIREKVWFPNMDAMTEEALKSCHACCAVVKDERLKPLSMSQLPDRPWQCLSADFGGPYPGGEYCFVVIDEFSRFPVVEIIKSTSSRTVIPVLNKIFSVHGFPDVMKTDNGPPFQSVEFKNFLGECGVEHRKITPLWPRANAQAENFMKPLNKAIKSANVEGKSWNSELYKFLRNYRATPHVTTNKPPAELLFGKNIKVLLPEIIQRENCDDLRKIDHDAKMKQKKYFDKRNCTKPTIDLKENDVVLIKQRVDNKLKSHYRPEPMVVTKVKGNMVTAKSPDFGTKTRNISQFKPIEDVNFNDESDKTDDEVVEFEPESTANDSLVNMPSSTNSDVSDHRPRRNRKRPARFKDFV